MSETTTIESLKFGSREINYELSYQDRKTLGIRVYPDCRVKVIAPLETTDENLKTKLKEKAPWIIRQQLEFLSYHPLTPPRKYVNGETHLYLGRQYRLKIDSTLNPKSMKLLSGRFLVGTADSKSIEAIMSKWYRKQAEIHFQHLLDVVLPRFRKYNLSTPPLQIQSMATRWGSCTPKGKIILNPELIKAPKGCIEYVIVHELCHLVHHNHTRKFYDLQSSILPDWEKWKERLERMLV